MSKMYVEMITLTHWHRPTTSSYVMLCMANVGAHLIFNQFLTLTVLVATIDAQWEGKGDVGSARYESALLPPCPTIRVLSYSN